MKISIITINYNNAEGLEGTLRSVSEQTCRDFEHIVIDGGSTDGSKEILERYAAGLSHWRSEKDKGIYNAMNKGIGMASGEYLLFLNSGDFLYDNDILGKTVPFLDGTDIVYGNILFNGKDRQFIQTYPDSLDTGFFFLKALGHPASFIKRQLFADGGYSEDLRIVSDWEFFLKKIIFENASYRHINQTISIFDMGGISSVNGELCSKERETILRKYFPGQVYGYVAELAGMKESPLYNIFAELTLTRKFQYRIKPLMKFLVTANGFFSGHRKKCN